MNVEDWDSCSEHESVFPRDGYCKDCRIEELQAKLEEMDAAYAEGIRYEQFIATLGDE